MQLVYYPDPSLVRICDESPDQSVEKRMQIAGDMWKIMVKYNGVGLAANQVGLNIRMFVWMENGWPQIVWNPRLSHLSGSSSEKEGCLSLPSVNITMERSTSSILSGQGISGLPVRFIGNTTTTRIWQHEMDHLQGRLIIDYMNRNETIANHKILKRLRKKRDT